MLLRNNPRLDVDRLAAQVRRQAALADNVPPWPGENVWLHSLEGRIVELGATSRPYSHAGTNDYSSLLQLPNDAFINATYWLILGRLPSQAEYQACIERLIAGCERERMLVELADEASSGGHAVSMLPGLAKGLARSRLKFKPKLGRIVRWVLGFMRLDKQRESLYHMGQLQDARYQAILDLLREQAQELSALQREYAGLRVENEVLRQQAATSSSTGKNYSLAAPPQGENKANSAGRDFYRALEARFRGDPAAIANLMMEHLPAVRDTTPLQHGFALLDLGCGRGEWLSLLRQEGIDARGVDLNAANVRACQEMGLDVHYQDALAALQSQDDASVGMVTSFHLVEHLSHQQLMALLSEAFRVLVEGGKLLLETPNPQNLLVGSCNFYLDPTHVRPLPPDFLAFLAEFSGFETVEIHPLHPVGNEFHLTDDTETARRLNHYLYGPQDYALFATKAAEGEQLAENAVSDLASPVANQQELSS